MGLSVTDESSKQKPGVWKGREGAAGRSEEPRLGHGWLPWGEPGLRGLRSHWVVSC